MASFTAVQYIPKMPNNNTTKLPAKPLWTNPGKEATKMQPALGAAAHSSWHMEPPGESNDMAQVASGVGSDANGAQDQIIQRENEDYDDKLMKRFLERFDPKRRPEVRTNPIDFGDAPRINEKAHILPDTSYPSLNTGDFDSVQFGTCEERPPAPAYTELAMEDEREFQNSTSISSTITETENPNKMLLFAKPKLEEHGRDCIRDSDGLAPGQRADDPILIEDTTFISEDSSQHAGWKAGHSTAYQENTNMSMPTLLNEALHVGHDIDNLDPERDTPFAKDPSETALQEPETPTHPPNPLHHTTISPSAGPAKEQGDILEPEEQHSAETITAACPTSDCGSGSSDDSGDEDYVEEPLPLAKRRRVRSSDTARYGPNQPQELPMSPADTFDNESQGSLPDTAYASEEIPVCGVLTLKEVDGKMLYCLTFSQDSLPRILGQKQDDTSYLASPSVQGRGRASRGRHSKFSVEDDQLIKRLKEDEGLAWDQIARQFPTSTKGSLQWRYSTKLKDRLGMPKLATKRATKRRRVE